MKLRILLATTLALFAFSTLSAQYCCDPCEGWSLYGEWIYMKIRRSDLDYVIDGKTGANNPDGKFKCVEPCYEHGFRVGFLKVCDEMDFGVRYTYLRVGEDSKIEDDANLELFATRLHPTNPGGLSNNGIAFGKSDFCLDLDIVDVELGMSVDLCEGKMVRPFAGLRYANIDQELNTIYQNAYVESGINGIKVCEDWDMNAYGLYLGAGVDWFFCDCFHFFGEFSSGIYAADFCVKHEEFEFDNNSNSDLGEGEKGDLLISASKDQWLIVTSYDLRLGIGYDVCNILCADWNFSVGYEFHKWHCLPEFIDFTNTNTKGTITRSKQNLGYDGLFVRAVAKF